MGFDTNKEFRLVFKPRLFSTIAGLDLWRGERCTHAPHKHNNKIPNDPTEDHTNTTDTPVTYTNRHEELIKDGFFDRMETELAGMNVQEHVAKCIEIALNPNYVSVIDLPMDSSKTSILRAGVLAHRTFAGKKKVLLYFAPTMTLAQEQKNSFWFKDIRCEVFGHSGEIKGLFPDTDVEVVLLCPETAATDRFHRYLQVDLTLQLQQ
jgi:hypothetical protein